MSADWGRTVVEDWLLRFAVKFANPSSRQTRWRKRTGARLLKTEVRLPVGRLSAKSETTDPKPPKTRTARSPTDPTADILQEIPWRTAEAEDSEAVGPEEEETLIEGTPQRGTGQDPGKEATPGRGLLVRADITRAGEEIHETRTTATIEIEGAPIEMTVAVTGIDTLVPEGLAPGLILQSTSEILGMLDLSTMTEEPTTLETTAMIDRLGGMTNTIGMMVEEEGIESLINGTLATTRIGLLTKAEVIAEEQVMIETIAEIEIENHLVEVLLIISLPRKTHQEIARRTPNPPGPTNPPRNPPRTNRTRK